MTASASPPPSATVTLPSSTSTFHSPAPSISKTYEFVMPGGLRGVGPRLEILEELLHALGHLSSLGSDPSESR